LVSATSVARSRIRRAMGAASLARAVSITRRSATGSSRTVRPSTSIESGSSVGDELPGRSSNARASSRAIRASPLSRVTCAASSMVTRTCGSSAPTERCATRS
jgi:hypothetical protein